MKGPMRAHGLCDEYRQPLAAPARALARGVGLVVLFGLSSIAPGPLPASPAAAGGQRVVLPSSVTPDHYRIDITPDAGDLTFKGSVDVDMTVHRAVHEIVLNSADLVIDRAGIVNHGAVRTIRYDKAIQTATLMLGRNLDPGSYTLRLEYHGKIYRQASGLFALDYDSSKGKARALFTQFENSDARRFVPSWDEPARKATFELTATVPADQMALSNMPITATDVLPGNRKRVHFATTPKMSSYLLYFGAGDFERVHRNVDGVDVGVVVKRGDTGSAAFALDAASNILPYFNSYFGVPFPLPKLDLIAAPGSSQFFDAMENWGAIFYFERELLIDPRISTERDKQGVYVVIAHEMAHQWFGDLVTMAWWDDLWLNEGFASWMENKVTEHFHPEWKLWLQALGEKQFAMQEDARGGTHPIITPINDVLQASDAFDSITYNKGAAVIRMLESYLGEDVFRAGVRRYIRKYAYGNTITDDLWAAMDEDSQRPIRQIAHDFTLQAGVPLVSELSRGCTDGRTVLGVAQGRFAIDAASNTAQLWHVPVFVAPIGAPAAAIVVAGPDPQAAEIAGCGAVVINAGQSGYFRSRYSAPGLAAITAAYGALSSDDQLGVLYDRSALANAGLEPMAAFLDLTKKFPADADPVVASALAGQLQILDMIYEGLPSQAAFRGYARSVLDPIFARVGWDKRPNENDNVALLRSELIAALSDLDDPSVQEEARKRFDRYVIDASSLDAGTRRTALSVVAAHADARTWDQLHRMAKSAATELEREELYDLLARVHGEALVQQALQLASSGEPPPTIAPEMIATASYRHPKIAFDFTVTHWDAISSLIEPASQSRFVPSLLNTASDPQLLDSLNGFAESHIPPDARQTLLKTEAVVRYHAAIRKDRLPEVDRWVQSQTAR
ncbi:MAG: M1 family metallopeptidase [Steroidobacteraceae bacterium]